jgi:hypothetical protein
LINTLRGNLSKKVEVGTARGGGDEDGEEK